MRRPPPLILLAMTALGAADVLAASILWRALYTDSEQGSVSPIEAHASSADGVPSLGAPLRIEAYEEIAARPVFWKSRSPWRPSVATNVQTVQPSAIQAVVATGFSLQAVVISPKGRRALISAPQQAEGAWISQGEMFSGWLLAQVDSGSAMLRQNDTELRLFLFPPSLPANQ